MVDNSQGTGTSPGNSIPCAQKSPERQTSAGMSAHSNNLHNTLQQNVAQGQHPTTNQQAFKQLPVAPQQQSSLLQPPAPGSHAAPVHQGQLQFIQPMVSPQGQPSRQPGQPSPFRQTFNPSAQPFIPAAEAQQNNTVPNTQEPKVFESTDGKGVKNGGPDGHLCFCYEQQGHLKKDCPLGPYCSRCNTKGHIPPNYPNKKGNRRMKCTKVGTSDLKKDAKTGKGHKTSHNIPIPRTNVYTVQATTGHVIAQQDISTRPHLPPILLAVQVHILLTIFLNFQTLHPNIIPSRVSLQLDHQH